MRRSERECGVQRSGFTLVEVLVAIAVGGMIVLGARAMLEQIADSADRLSATATAIDRIANTEGTVRGLFERTVVPDSTTAFVGQGTSLHFGSWCDVPAGWRERCTVSTDVVLSPNDNTNSISHLGISHLAVVVRTSMGDTLILRDGLTSVALRYVDDVTNGGHSIPRWLDSLNTPLAVGVVTDQDTLILRIGPRR